ncbi:branched-chain amino acid transport system II carrier protein [Streptococcus azizii]|uniref:Branched-chain amino acid transport system carrier protein n=1 Tax=Streptococcus azizii TaxID=1579424 RepID=A0AB36JT57_9STRE|nr:MULTISPECIES: branched-chain amino acid transport system II carrier protein [Streptococcus]MBF0775816.1 branched-chain amino acid transport system II carrier protein [Streptococcus sp. 19428wD3_AN2]ONK29222.1 branched-chain amino acid transport system II carrier protein [Streptococcus azizii]ONK29768.1 branched-chain amino acid transport system II carrier protein [Streptococcus azizii]ONK30706.1 branched-chain amino acid transport system II carrier protein [Streptococcus azizii]TFU84103.1 b
MIKKGSLTGLLLFGIFFGAGNLIFPPTLGVLSGENFWPAISGFVLSGVGIAVLTLIIGTLNPKGYVDEISRKIAPWFATVYLVALYLSIGPFFAIPRTATTAYEVGIAPLLATNSQWGLLIFTAVYFIAAYLISLNPSKILDLVGRILTPVFALLIVVLVILGATKYGSSSPAAASATYVTSAFGTGFLEGYNTLDALASVAFSVIAVETMNQLGFASKKEYVSTIWIVGIVVALGFSALYIGLGFLGNHFPIPAEVMASETNKGVYVLSQATQAIFGSTAQIFLAIMVTMTCFTTTVGLIVSTSEFFVKTFPQLGYKVYATLFTLIGFGIANIGLSAIISYSVPVLQILYPITIAIVLLVIVNRLVPLSKIGMQLTISLVTIIAFATIIADQFKLEGIHQVIQALPFAEASLPWLVPAVVGILFSICMPDGQTTEEFTLE